MSIFQKVDEKKTIYQHLSDIRKFLIISIILYIPIFVVCFIYTKDIYKILANPLSQALSKLDIEPQIIALTLTEVFSTYLKISFNSSLLIFIPLFLAMLFLFIFAATSIKERKVMIIVLVCSPILFVLGLIFAYYVMFNIAWGFFTRFSLMFNNVTLMPSVEQYIGLSFKILIAFGISFQLPIVIFLLCILSIINKKDILKFSKYFVLIAFILGAILTPPDPLSQIIVASVLLALYFLSYLLVSIVK